MIFTRTGLTQEIIQQYGAYSYMQKQKAEENPPCNNPDSFFLFVAQRGEGLCKEKETHLSAFYPVDADRRPIFFYILATLRIFWLEGQREQGNQASTLTHLDLDLKNGEMPVI